MQVGLFFSNWKCSYFCRLLLYQRNGGIVVLIGEMEGKHGNVTTCKLSQVVDSMQPICFYNEIKKIRVI